MSRLVASGFATAIAIAMLAGAAMKPVTPAAEAAPPAPIAAPLVEVEFGQCQIQYDALPAAHQPAPMECEHANWVAQRWGGRVMESTGAGMIERAAYDGANDFTNVPTTELPRAGYCRAWLNDVAAHEQPAQSDCREARRMAASLGGRVIFMPL
ncbi:MAG TPA: hypothetical protein VM915_01115 [Verrucomicrobiae bacterium]|jgi:hypothetical protein|nr:hypothetical protein [Verrucomicrobiae bacterium]